MKKLFIILFAFAVSINTVIAQDQENAPVISFEKTTHDYGDIKEADGLAEYTFTFENTGKKNLIVKSVRTSCGCTVPEWSKQPIPPKGNGTIKVSYNPLRRPGKFKKSITVQSNASTPRVVLYIEGLVEAKPKTFEDLYPLTMGPIRVSTNHLSMTTVVKGQNKSAFLDVANMSEENVKITIPDIPDHLSFSVQPKTLAPKQKGRLQVTYDSRKVDDWGFNYKSFNLFLNGEKIDRPSLTVSATILEDFSHLSPLDKAKAARLVIKETKYDFGSIKSGDKIQHDFIIRNEGKETLFFRKISTSCTCLTAVPSLNEIPAGAEAKIHIIFDSSRRRGRQSQRITMITNDPMKPTHILNLAGQIESPAKK